MPNTIPAAGEAMPDVTVEGLIASHRNAVIADEALFDDDGKPLVARKAVKESERAEWEAFINLVNARCIKDDDVRAKIDYFVNGTIGIRSSLIEYLIEYSDGDVDLVGALLTSLNVETEVEHPWTKARRLMKELSDTLGDCSGGKWSAYVMPPVPPVFNGFAAYPMGQKPDEVPVDHVERLSWELSEALSRYQNGAFQAVVLPSSSAGHTVRGWVTAHYG